ncbi:hypothetical protein E4U16_001502 [Claviceps sp. LM84 group G4]|nr:hypothetical protein E4U33_000711 [Claviceps sp. LM78 group G4]KAG6078736.1 hypothetical protein E4U16_001502 [Claviceps sp. LM84 group G4]
MYFRRNHDCTTGFQEHRPIGFRNNKRQQATTKEQGQRESSGVREPRGGKDKSRRLAAPDSLSPGPQRTHINWTANDDDPHEQEDSQ